MAKPKIETLRAKIARLEAEIAHELYVELAVLPKQFGFSSAAEFLRAVMKAAGGKKRGRAGRPKAEKPPRRRPKQRPLRKSAAAREGTPVHQLPIETLIPPASYSD
jgi:hypothetical protein